MVDTQLGQKHDRTALVLYGSETGNSQDVAEDLGRLAQRLHFVTRVCEMDQVQIVSLLCSFQRNFNTLKYLFLTE
jgi:sulfite reductase alpha subunit-like flavoprotein